MYRFSTTQKMYSYSMALCIFFVHNTRIYGNTLARSHGCDQRPLEHSRERFSLLERAGFLAMVEHQTNQAYIERLQCFGLQM